MEPVAWSQAQARLVESVEDFQLGKKTERAYVIKIISFSKAVLIVRIKFITMGTI